MKSRKCDTAKYQRRRRKERLNGIEHVARERVREKKRREEWQEELRHRAFVREHDPRHQLEQRLVNALYAKLSRSPMWKFEQMSRAMGFSAFRIFKGGEEANHGTH